MQTNQQTVMTWNETLAFRKRLETINILTKAQLAKAYAICSRFGEGFKGIKDRCDWVAYDLTNREAVQELLTSVNPVLAKEILEAEANGWIHTTVTAEESR